MNQSTYFSGIDFTALIHTMQGVSDNALLPEEEINAKPYIKNFHMASHKAVYRINPNKYGAEITSLAELKNTLSLILDELYVTDYEIKRLDVSINTIVPFDDIYKINNYLKELYAVHISSFGCSHETAAMEFQFTLDRTKMKKGDNLAHHLMPFLVNRSECK